MSVPCMGVAIWGCRIHYCNLLFLLVPGAGLEPARYRYRGILSPLCLPIPPPGLGIYIYFSINIINGGWGRNRTGVDGFAGRCITTLPPSLITSANISIKVKTPGYTRGFITNMERETRFELATSSLATRCSTTELFPPVTFHHSLKARTL